MLVLKRKQGQSIIIGGNIVVKIIEVEGKSVKVGIEAPKHINIVREELLERAKEKMIGATVKPDVAKDVKISEPDKPEGKAEEAVKEKGVKTEENPEELGGNPERGEEGGKKKVIIKKGNKRASANLKGE